MRRKNMGRYEWWQKAVFYQIYPRSFADSNGDGIGDLEGAIQKLDYLKNLGIDAIWLSPHYPSPLWDVGYDVANYNAVAPEYGTLDTFKRFLEEAHRRDIRLILDLVLNHTSDQHPWFIESRSSRDNPKRDWYIWRDAKPDVPPNNWYSTFGGSAWEYDPLTEQAYYHFFFKQQPDLNWRNPEVHQAIMDSMRFWYDLGVDGFRMDAIGTLFEEPDLRNHDAPITQTELYRMGRLAKTPEEQAEVTRLRKIMFKYQHDLPGMHEVMQSLRRLTDEYPGRMLVAETDDVTYYGNGSNEVHMVFNFPLMRTNHLAPAWIRANQNDRLDSIPPAGWPCNTLGNHDSARLVSHFGDGKHDDAFARLGLALMLTIRGTPFLYNGEEIGMRDYLLQDIKQFKDMLGLWLYNNEINTMKSPPEEAVTYAALMSRDKCRTPMQWRNAPNGGFCPPEIEPWLPVNPDFSQGINVEEQANHADSLLKFYREMLHMRRATPALITGAYVPVHEEAKDYFAFLRRSEEEMQTVLVVLSYTDQPLTLRFDLPGARRVVYSSRKDGAPVNLAALEIEPFGLFIAELEHANE